MTTLADYISESQPGFACGKEDAAGMFQFRMNNVTRDGRVDLGKRRRVPLDAHKNIERFLVQPDDVLFNATNSPDGVGKSILVPALTEKAVFSNHFLRIRPRPERLSSAYLARWLHWNFQRGVFQGMCRQWVNQATVSREALLGMPFEPPALEEQRRIAAILDQADALRAKRREALALLADLTQSIFIDMFGDTTDGNSHYEPLPLAEWIDPARPITYGILKPGPDTDGGVPYVRVADMKEGGIAVNGVRRTTREIDAAYRRSRLRAGDLLMSIRGHVGRLAEIPVALDGANITQDSARLAIARGAAPFVRGALESPGLQRWMARRTKGAAVRGINLGDLRRAPIPDAPVDQQEAFAARTGELRRLQEKAKSQLKANEKLFAALQARAFTGQS